jgi:hypothetical protein
MLDVTKMVDAVLDAMDKSLRAFHERLKVMEARLAELEAVPQLTTAGYGTRRSFIGPARW